MNAMMIRRGGGGEVSFPDPNVREAEDNRLPMTSHYCTSLRWFGSGYETEGGGGEGGVGGTRGSCLIERTPLKFDPM